MADAAPQVTTERELKLSAWPEFTLPDLNGVIKGARAVAADEPSLEAVHFDTADLRLLRRAEASHPHRKGREDQVKAGPPDQAAATLRRSLSLHRRPT